MIPQKKNKSRQDNLQTPTDFAVPGTWIPTLPAGMTQWGLNHYLAGSYHYKHYPNAFHTAE